MKTKHFFFIGTITTTILFFAILNSSVYDFLNVGLSARPNAMGGSFSAVSHNIDALQWNPAGLNGIENSILSTGMLLYTKAGLRFGEINYGFNKQKNTFGFGINYVNYGSIEKRGENNEDLGTFSPIDMVFLSGFSRRITNELTTGIGAKFVYERIDSFLSYGAGVDLGIQYLMKERNLTIGIVLKNIGKELKAHYEEKGSFPMSLTGGVSFHPLNVINMNFDYTKFLTISRSIAKFGIEWQAVPMFAVRAGYNSTGSDLKTGYTSDLFAGTSFGVGFSWKKFYLDYAVQPMADLGISHSITISHIF